MSADDDRALLAILEQSEVFKWWGAHDLQKVREEFVGESTIFVIEADGEIAGAIQYWEDTDPMYRRASLDIFLGREWHGRGLGTEAIRVLTHYLFGERGHHRLTIDPAVANAAAIRAYERVGFKPVGVMRSYERGPEGEWHDGLLMDMLQEDFTP